ncbi:LuxR C-terminal-related transcriptional regulator [Streptomyces sp. NPDC049585]
MAQGLGNAALARRLDITDNAVQKHIRSIFAKLGLPSNDKERHLEALGR